MTTLREIKDNFASKLKNSYLFLNQISKSYEKENKNLLPIPLAILKSQISKEKYAYYNILVGQLVMGKVLDNYIDSYLFSYDLKEFDIDFALIKLKEKIIKEGIICDEIVNKIFKEIDKLEVQK